MKLLYKVNHLGEKGPVWIIRWTLRGGWNESIAQAYLGYTHLVIKSLMGTFLSYNGFLKRVEDTRKKWKIEKGNKIMFVTYHVQNYRGHVGGANLTDSLSERLDFNNWLPWGIQGCHEKFNIMHMCAEITRKWHNISGNSSLYLYPPYIL